jgi:hypothetical protein
MADSLPVVRAHHKLIRSPNTKSNPLSDSATIIQPTVPNIYPDASTKFVPNIYPNATPNSSSDVIADSNSVITAHR